MRTNRTTVNNHAANNDCLPATARLGQRASRANFRSDSDRCAPPGEVSAGIDVRRPYRVGGSDGPHVLRNGMRQP